MSSVTRVRRISAALYISIPIAAAAAMWAIASPAQAGPTPMRLVEHGPATGPTTHGFVWSQGQTITIDHPDAVTFTAVAAINRLGIMVGSYDDASGVHGFVRDTAGRFFPIDFPDAARTVAHRINDAGQIVGAYLPEGSNLRQGFLLDEGTFITIEVQDAISTDANGINEAGQIGGWYMDRNGSVHGMVWNHGIVTKIDVPDAPDAQTELIDINDKGELVGDYAIPPTVALHGVLVSHGMFTTFDHPDFPLTSGLGLNNAAQIVGSAASDPQETEVVGFVLGRGVGGPFTTFAIPGAARTDPFDITDSGQIVGSYQTATDSSGPASPPDALGWPGDTRRAF